MSMITVSRLLLSMLSVVTHTAFNPQPTITTETGWQITRVGHGGEPTVSTNGKGVVYVTSHIPTQVLMSSDKGSNFTQTAVFNESLGDMVALARPDGGVTCSYMLPGDHGIHTQVSEDYGHTFNGGAPVQDRPVDREWLTYDAAKDRMYMIYSDGYIGGPPSKGVFMSVSLDRGLTFKQISRIDKSPVGDMAIDPHLVISTDGRLYAFWTITRDRNTVESYHVADSVDGGMTWENQQTIALLPHDLGDRQERWMLGGLCSYGTSTVTCFYVCYDRQPVEIGDPVVLRVATRTSTDGGATFGKQVWAVSDDEAMRCTKQVGQSDIVTQFHMPWIQVEPWATYDPKGRLYVMWFDNREGTTDSLQKEAAHWQLRYSVPGTGDAKSARVGQTFDAARPAMDYMSCTADDSNVYASWSQNGGGGAWDFTGDLWFGRLATSTAAP